MSQPVTKTQHKGAVPKSNEFDDFVIWFALPGTQKKQMEIETLEQFANNNNVSIRTLIRWKQRPEFEVKVRDMRKRWAFDKTSDVIEAIHKSATRGNDKSQKLWFQLFEGFSERTENVQTQQVELSVNDLRFLIQAFPLDEQDKYYGYIRQIIDRAAIIGSEIERGEIPEHLAYIEASATDSTEDVEGSVSDEADINAQHLQVERDDEISESHPFSLRSNMVRKISAYHHQSSSRRGEIKAPGYVRIRRLVLAETQGCQHGRISGAGDDCL